MFRVDQLLNEENADLFREWRENYAMLREVSPVPYYGLLLEYAGHNPFQEQVEVYSEIVINNNYETFRFLLVASVLGVRVSSLSIKVVF